jgi:hypothetical protein
VLARVLARTYYMSTVSILVVSSTIPTIGKVFGLFYAVIELLVCGANSSLTVREKRSEFSVSK